MPTEKPKWQTSPSECRSVFAEVERRLRESLWFRDGWSVVVGEREDITWLGLNKVSWQTSGLEIHFESWIKREQIARRRVPVAMHVEGGHHTRRYAFNTRFHTDVAELVQSWEGYVIKDAGMTRLAISIPLDQDALAPALALEFTRLAQLGPVVDRIVDTMRR